MENLEKMFETGLFINDLSMHDSSRDLVLAGTQQQAELKMALDQVEKTSKWKIHPSIWESLTDILVNIVGMNRFCVSVFLFIGFVVYGKIVDGLNCMKLRTKYSIGAADFSS